MRGAWTSAQARLLAPRGKERYDIRCRIGTAGAFSMMNLPVLVALFTLIALAPATVSAQDWPNRPVRFIVPFPAGGSTDVAARVIGEYLSRSLRQQIIVENKTGANGNIGLETAAKSPANGYTILFGTDSVGIKLEQVPYRGGAQAINDLVAGHMRLGSLGSTPLIPHYKAGTLRLLAQSMAARSPSLPDVPTYQDAGIKLVLDQWLGVFVPAGTPPAISARLNAEIGKALGEAAIRESFLQSAQEPVGGAAEQFSHFVQEEFAKYGRLVKELNIKAN